jgi:hypothetical protein
LQQHSIESKGRQQLLLLLVLVLPLMPLLNLLQLSQWIPPPPAPRGHSIS